MLNNQNLRKERRGSVSGVTIGGLRSSNGIVIKPLDAESSDGADNTAAATSGTNIAPESENIPRTDAPVTPLALADVPDTSTTQSQTSPHELNNSSHTTRASTRFLASRPSISSRNVTLVRQVNSRSMTVSASFKLEPAPTTSPPDVPHNTIDKESNEGNRESFADDLLNKFEQLNITFKIPSVADQIRMPVMRGDTIESVKVSLYQEVLKKYKLLGTEHEYVLRAEDDDYWIDEGSILYV